MFSWKGGHDTKLMTHFNRELVVDTRRDYRQIVYHPILDQRAWISLSKLTKIADSDYRVREEYFIEGRNEKIHNEPSWEIPVDLFFLTKEETRKLYQAPNEHASFRLISPDSKLFPGKCEEKFGYDYTFFITQIEKGFALLYDFGDRCWDVKELVGRIKIREEEKLTIWLVVPLSP